MLSLHMDDLSLKRDLCDGKPYKGQNRRCYGFALLDLLTICSPPLTLLGNDGQVFSWTLDQESSWIWTHTLAFISQSEKTSRVTDGGGVSENPASS